MTVQFLKHDGETLAWQHQAGNRPVGVVFLGGWCSDMNGSKAVFLADWCAHRGIPLTRLDYRAHGQSSGQLVDFTIGGALADVLAVLQETAQGPQVIVGSSMGGWLALLLATRHPQYVKAMVGIAAAPDFTTDLMYPNLPTAEKETLKHAGQCQLPNGYQPAPVMIGQKLFDESEQHLLLRHPLNITVPVRLLHGLRDDDVPYARSLLLMDRITGADVRTTLIKDGDHRLTRPQDLALLAQQIDECL